ncbi:MAG TPA: 2OG-Fe(II) oxygenase [Chthoniobacteraceae bacterium]|nr:2OG-Fe(II) oxygenase [Chthoniobacteraceae bacterium]
MVSVSLLVKRSKNDGAAAMALSHSRLYGVGCKSDQRAAFNAVRLAARLGHPDGRRARIYMTAAGIGTKPDHSAAMEMLKELAKEDKFAALQLSLLDHVVCEQRLREVQPKVISSDPYIALYPGLFSPAECKYLAVIAAPWLEKAMVTAESGGTQFGGVRDADSSAISHLTEDLIVQRINRCIAAATGTQTEWGEPLNVLRYRQGQQYRQHHDGCGSGDGTTRIITALIWLNEQFDGGETEFPKLNIRVRGGLGGMLVFRNVHADGSQDDRLIHAGLPVSHGVKWLASRWIRATDFLEHG